MPIPTHTPNATRRFDSPLYGEAAAIYAMYQGFLIEQEQGREQAE